MAGTPSNAINISTDGVTYFNGPESTSIANGTQGQVLTMGASLPAFADLPALVAFTAQVSTTVSNVTGDGTEYQIIANTVGLNLGSAYNGTTGIFTAPRAGQYFFNAVVSLSAVASDQTDCLIDIFVNGSQSQILRCNPFNYQSPSGNLLNVNYFANLNISDQISLRVIISGGTKTISVVGGGTEGGTIFNGFSV